MSPRAWQTRVQDMLDAIAELQQFTAGLSLAQFQADAKTLKAVMANFTIIGEAARHLGTGSV